ncbi:hypothetical protein [Acinetobacter oleivorans]|jgi:hypothetical protein|uniref:Lipoprotein n=1 Tax=Acinetobacter oleivorans (strain JCM 16667 / KCTC 23045 / DR1) TaxID=436717 RepID=A0AAN0PC85_ACISD|nr:hypothetical protein [Acinetobacter oleivorans]ADI92667.1 hypothetical protein AOLE_18925 [Acinetobacter oleivorans DR1]ESK43891.1 hypothetical protein P254_03041 [Acinetobacter oleivorans CIP 110421]MBJ9421762.1 hypothetical protein [Acinetobacter oleivorans]WQF72854.1 hypothetical protein OKW95_18915 [Acinetobacter oleivorans]
MKKILYLSGLIFLTGCSERISNFTIDHIMKSNEKLNFSIKIEGKEVLNKIKKSSSKKLICENMIDPQQTLDADIDRFENNQIDVSVEFCSNNDNRSCEPIDISSVKKINLECQAIFSAMIGNVSKSEKFPIVWEEK